MNREEKLTQHILEQVNRKEKKTTVSFQSTNSLYWYTTLCASFETSRNLFNTAAKKIQAKKLTQASWSGMNDCSLGSSGVYL